MVSIRGHSYGRWVARRRALATRLLVLHDMGYYLGELAVLLRAYRRAVREVALLRERSIHVRAVSFNINAFSSRNPCLSFAFFPTMLDNLLCCCRWMYLFRTRSML